LDEDKEKDLMINDQI